jgi:hypothetical protein
VAVTEKLHTSPLHKMLYGQKIYVCSYPVNEYETEHVIKRLEGNVSADHDEILEYLAKQYINI